MADRVWARIRKEFIEVFRDRRSLGIILIQPAILLLLFGYAINTTVEHVATIVLGQADDRVSREVVARAGGAGRAAVAGDQRGPRSMIRTLRAAASSGLMTAEYRQKIRSGAGSGRSISYGAVAWNVPSSLPEPPRGWWLT